MNRRCPKCNAVVPSDAPDGVCPVCLLSSAIEGDEPSHPEPGAAASPIGAPPGKVLHYFGDYELLEEIARGGMGLVFRARQVSLNRTVALKMILTGRLAKETEVKRFQAEAEAVARLQHPNIVAIHEVGVHEGQHYFSMDFVAGKDLAALVRENPLPAAVAARYVKTIAEAIHYAHQQGVLHRDLKPSNVLVDQNDQPHITDFGLAKQLHSDSDVTRSGQVLGTPSFMPPEQAGGRKAQIGPHSDVYSLGAILYYLLTGRPPFLAATLEATLAQVLNAEPPSPRALNGAVPRDLETVCLRCLEKDPARRYATAQELALELERFLGGVPVLARPVGRAAKAWRWCRRNPALAVSLAGALLLLVALALGSTLGALRIAAARNAERSQRLRAETREAESQARLARLRIEEGWRLVERGDWFEGLVPFVDALELEHGDPAREAADRDRIACLLQCGPQLRRMWFPGGPLSRVELSPDGRRVLTATASVGAHSSRGAAQVWDLSTGRPLTPPMSHAGRINFACFSPDGSRVATASEDGSARVWDAATGQPITPPLRLPRGVAHVAFSGDGKHLAACSAPDWYTQTNGCVIVWDTTTGRAEYTNETYGMDAQLVAFANHDHWLLIGSKTFLCNIINPQTGEDVGAVPDDWVTYAVALSPDGSKILVAGDFGLYKELGARVFDLRTWKALTPLLPQSEGLPLVAAWSPEGRLIATAIDNRAVQVWDAATGQPRGAPLRHEGSVVSAVFSRDGRRVLTASRDGTARVWDTETGLPACAPLVHGGPVCNAWFAKDGQEVVTGSEDGAVRVWDLAPRAPAQRILLARGKVRRARFSPDGRRIVTADSGGVAQLWDASTLQPVGPPMNHSSNLLMAKFSRKGRRLLTFCEDYSVRVWDLSRVVPKMLWLSGAQSADITSDGRRVVVPYWDHIGRILNGDTGAPLSPSLYTLLPKGVTEICRNARFSPDNRWVGFADDYGKVGLWEVATLRPGPHFQAHAARVNDLRFSPDSRLFVTVSDDNTARLWDTRTGAPLSGPLRHAGPVRTAAFSPNATHVVTGSDDGTARLWACPGGQPVGEPMVHAGPITEVCFSPHGGRVATASSDGSARVWDAETGEPLTPPLVHAGQVRSVQFSPDGRFLLTASDDQTARLWSLPTDRRPITQLVSEALLVSAASPAANSPSIQERWRAFCQSSAGSWGRLNPAVTRRSRLKRQRTAALQDASALAGTRELPPGFGVRQPSAALALHPRSPPSTLEHTRGAPPKASLDQRQPGASGKSARLALLLQALEQVSQQHDYHANIRVLTRLIVLDTNQWTWLFARAYARSRLGDFKEAAEDYSRALSVAPQASVCLLGRYLAHSALNDPAAPADIREMVRRRDSFSGVPLNKITVADPSLPEQWETIVRDCTADLRNGPPAFRLYCARGAAEGGQFRFRLARMDFGEALKLQPNHAEVWLAVALIYRYLGSRVPPCWQNAADAANHVLKLEPGDPLAESIRAEALKRLKEFPKSFGR